MKTYNEIRRILSEEIKGMNKRIKTMDSNQKKDQDFRHEIHCMGILLRIEEINNLLKRNNHE
jgi:hypothetical protein